MAAMTSVNCQTVENDPLPLALPVFGAFKVMLIISWLNVSSCIDNPFGDDAVDFQLFALIKRHLAVS